MLLIPTNMLLHPGPYAKVPKQPWDPMSASVNTVNLAVKMDQPAQSTAPEAWVYGTKSKVWLYGLFPSEKMSAKLRVSCVYNSL